jgi:phosphate starvation-inducible PhoH-like protein
VAHALSEVLTKKRKKLILTRPVVEAGENLGFLPGDLSQKISPYLRPLYDAIEDLLPPELVLKMEDSRMIEVAPLAYMRGRSLKNCYVVLDEAQNTTKTQMKMFLTRIGENARVVVTGDPSQSDLPGSKTSGLLHAQRVLSDIQDISFTHFKRRDVVRHPLVQKIIEAYEQE